jgi:pimeloyl-CoA dehydrogenase small subunit
LLLFFKKEVLFTFLEKTELYRGLRPRSMDLDLTEEQRLLSETVTRFVAGRYDFQSREKYLRQPQGFSCAIWSELGQLGLLALPFTEEDGGFGAGGIETMLVMEALGSALVVEPYLSTVILCGTALRMAATSSQKSALLPGLVGGGTFLALAHAERRAPRHTLTDIRTTAEQCNGGWVLDGQKTAVLNGDSADIFIVSARTGNDVTLFLIDAKAPGVHVRGRPAYDGSRIADLTFNGVRAAPDAVLGRQGAGADILRSVIETATAAVAAEAVGIMTGMLATTVEYLKTRRQFGVSIGSFQALQHRCVDMLIQVELARSMALFAAVSLALDNPAERARNIAAAKIQIGRSGKFVGQQAVQLHGAIGITAEYKVGHAFKRLTAIDTLFGDANHHLDVLAEAGGLG